MKRYHVRKRGRAHAWKWMRGILIGDALLFGCAAGFAWLIQRGSVSMTAVFTLRWIIIGISLILGCSFAAKSSESSRLLHAALTGAALLATMLASGRVLGTERFIGLPFAAGMTAAAALLGAVLTAGGKQGYK